MAREAISALQFFKALYDGVGAGNIEIRPIEEGSSEPPHPKFFSWPKEVEKAAAFCESLSGKAHVYFGVGLRRMTRKPKDNPNYKLGGKENVGCVTAVFVDVDFKDVPEAELRAMLAAFPLRPSIVVRSGNGIHAYWLLDYPAMGEHRDTLQKINLSILDRFRAQKGVQDYTRILRVPGTQNIKAKYPDPKPVTEVSYFHPETKYKLEQFLDVLKPEIESLSRPEGAGPSTRHAGTSTAEAHSPGSPPPPVSSDHKPKPAKELTPELMQKLSELLTGIWIDHHHHYLAMYVSGILAHAGYTQESALRLLRAVCTLAGDVKELHDRERVCADTYEKHASGQPVAGGPSMEALVKNFPGIIRERALKVYEIVRKSLPKAEKKTSDDGGKPGLEFTALVKFNSDPILWKVEGKLFDGTEFKVTVEGPVLHNFQTFQMAVFQEAHVMLFDMKQAKWHELIGRFSHLVTVEEAPPESRVNGAIEMALNSFLEDARYTPEIGLLKSYPGYDDGSKYFKIDTLKRFLKDVGVKVEDHLIYNTIKGMGWKTGVRRFGEKTQRLWILDAPAAVPAHVQGNGHAKPAQPTSKVEKGLFDAV